MQYEDLITIPTPEGIELDYALAGAGSRFLAELVDIILRLVVLGALLAVLAALGSKNTAARVVAIVAAFLAWFMYDIVFEVWGGGRTPAKRWSGLRVVKAGGQPVGLGASAARTLLRIIDQWATLGLLGMLLISVTGRNQRLGDLAGGTIVLRERRPAKARPETAGVPTAEPGLDVTRVTASDVATLRDFLARRDSLATEARARVAQALADGLAGKVGGLPPGGLPAERLLEAVVAAKRPSGDRPGGDR